MWSTSFSITTDKVDQKQIWDIWTDVSHWSNWDHDIENSEIFGNFELGTNGRLKSLGGPNSHFSITECTPLVSFTTHSSLPFCELDFSHVMIRDHDTITITHTATMSGYMTFLFSRIIGSKIQA
jgi:hypothetical protein